MKRTVLFLIALCLYVLSSNAQVGNPYIHDPSTIAACEGKYYTFGTGGEDSSPKMAGRGIVGQSVLVAVLLLMC